MLHHEAAVLDDFDAGGGEFLGGFVVADAELEPDVLRFCRQDVVDVRRDVDPTAEDVHHVHGSSDGGQRAEDRLAEDLRHFRVVDGDGNDLVPMRGHVRGDVVRGL